MGGFIERALVPGKPHQENGQPVVDHPPPLPPQDSRARSSLAVDVCVQASIERAYIDCLRMLAVEDNRQVDSAVDKRNARREKG